MIELHKLKRVHWTPLGAWKDDKNPGYAYKVTLRNPETGATLTTPFRTGCGWQAAPSAADVLGSLLQDASLGRQSFEDFCGDVGYDADSRAAEATWKECVSIYHRLRRFLGVNPDDIADAEEWGERNADRTRGPIPREARV